AETRFGDDDRIVYYQPAIDINQLSVGFLFSKIDERGSENFKIDTSELFRKEWKALLKTREDMMKENASSLLKDI
ncbi:MAG: YihY/virulence factor BrkB family protein, partial [Massilibacteroides sp.]|nr:YihY/virulence factor BrkB family protein [Massilibacteroides sp.]